MIERVISLEENCKTNNKKIEQLEMKAEQIYGLVASVNQLTNEIKRYA